MNLFAEINFFCFSTYVGLVYCIAYVSNAMLVCRIASVSVQLLSQKLWVGNPHSHSPSPDQFYYFVSGSCLWVAYRDDHAP